MGVLGKASSRGEEESFVFWTRVEKTFNGL